MSTEKTLIPLDLWCKYFRPPKLCFALKKTKKTHKFFVFILVDWKIPFRRIKGHKS